MVSLPPALSARWPHLLLALLLLAALSPRAVPAPLVRSVQAGAVALEGRHPEVALAHFEQALAVEPVTGALHVLAALAAQRAADPVAALAHLEAAGRQLGDDPSRACLHGLLLLETGDLEAAVQRWRQAESVCLRDPAVLEAYADAARKAGDLAQALEAATAWSLAAPGAAAAWRARGLLEAAAGSEQASGSLRLALELAPAPDRLALDVLDVLRQAASDGPPAYLRAQVGQALARAGEWELAAQAFEQALALEPDYLEARGYLGLALDRLGGDGLPHLLEAAQAAPEAALPHLLLGMHWRRHGRPQTALDELRVAARLDPDHPAIAAEIGAVYEDLGDAATALQAYRVAAALAPDDPGFWLLLAEASLEHEIEVSTLGVPAARNAAALRPEAPALAALGYAHLLTGEAILAERLITRAAALDPGLPAAQYRLGLLRLLQGRAPEARRALEAAVALDPAGPIGLRAARTLGALPAPP